MIISSCPVTKFTAQLIQCPSISPDDAGCQEMMIHRLQKIGFTVECMNFGDTKNFWAYRGERKYRETLVFVGHTDVVPVGDVSCWIFPPFEPTIKNGILFGRGAADMKGSLAAMIIAAENFVATHPNHKGRLAFLITSDEESSAKNGTLKVVEYLTSCNERLDYCLVGEPSSIELVGDVIKNGRRGSLTCYLTIYGVQGHVAYSNSSKDNPIHCAAPMINELISTEWDKGNKFFPKTSMQILNIKAENSGSNVIPSHLFLEFNFRFNTEVTDQIIKQRVVSLLDKYNFHYIANWKLFGQPFFTQHGKLVDSVINTIFRFNKRKPKLLTTGGTSDGRFFAKMGTQVVELGLINSTIHKINECVNIKDLQILAHMYQKIMEEIII